MTFPAGLAQHRGVWLDDPRFGGKAPNGIKPVDVVDRTLFHPVWVLSFPQRRRDALHHCRRNSSDMTLGGTMHMTAENSNDPAGVLQSPAQT